MKTSCITVVSSLFFIGCPTPAPAPSTDNDTHVADAPTDGPPDSASPPDAVADSPPEATPSGIASVTFPNGWKAKIDRGAGVWFVDDGHGKTVLTGGGRGANSVLIGRGEPTVEAAFGGFRIDMDAVDWTPLPQAAPTRVEAGADTLRASWELAEGGELVLTFSAFGPAEDPAADVRVELSAEGGHDVTAAALVLESPEEQAFFGLGAQVFGMDLRGGRFPLWTQEQGIGKPDDYDLFPFANIREASYAPMGIWHATAAGTLGDHTAIIGHDGFSELDIAETVSDAVVLRSFQQLPSFVLVDGDDPGARLSRLGDYVGRPPEPQPWVFGPWNDAVGGPEHLAAVAATLRSNGVPSSAIWAEDWIGGQEGSTGYRLSYSWEWDPTLYPDLPADIAALHADGFAFLGYFNTFVPDTTDRYPAGEAAGHLVKDAAGDTYLFVDPAGRDASLVDLTSPAATQWFEGYMRTAAETLGMDGWMADFTEWMPHDAVLASGETGWQYHNRYPLDFQRLNSAVLGDNDGVFFARSGWASVNGGSAGTAMTMWGGDQDTDWDDDDGYPSIVPIAAHLGLCGVSYFGTDIAGYSSFFSPYTTKELFYRWASAAALTPLMRTHHGSSECGNWSFDRDAETLAHYKRWAIVHTLLYPHLRQLSAQTQSRGWPMIRHPYLVAPEQPELWRDQDYAWFLGSDLYVAPVLLEGATSREVILPSGQWWPLFGDAPLAGGGVTVAAPPTELPVFVRAGTIVPLLTAPVDSFYGASSDAVTDLDDAAGAYRLALYPGADGSVRELQLEGSTVNATALSAPLDYSSATVDGEPVPGCDAAADDESCHGDGVVRVVAASATIAMGAATVVIAGADVRTWELSVAGQAWGALAQATELTELNPDIPPPCL